MARLAGTLGLLALLGGAWLWIAEDDDGRSFAPVLDTPPLPKAHAWERAQWHVLKRLAEGQDHLPMGALDAAREQRARLPRHNAAAQYRQRFPESALSKAAVDWQSLGPTEKGGRTRRVVIDANGTMYASGVSGGVWRLEGGLWRSTGDRLANVNVGALAIDDADVSVMYAGTGELYRRTNRPYSSMTGSGMFKSTNAGEDWVPLEATRNDDFLYVSDIVLSPSDSRRLYAATNTGVWRSDDGGASFVQTLSTDEGQGTRFEGCTDLDIRPDGAGDQVLAACSSRSVDDRYYLPGLITDPCNGPCDGRIYLNRNADLGDAWEIVLTEAGMGRVSIARAPTNPEILYAVAASIDPGPDKNGDGLGDYDNGLHAVYRSDDGGATWSATLRNTDPDPVSTWMLSFAWQARSDGQTPYGAGWYNQAIAVDPSDPDVVWVGGMQLYRSDDAGQSFGLLSNYYFDSDIPGSGGPQMHPDIHALTFDAADRLWVGNDGGVWLTGNRLAPANLVDDGYRSLLTSGANFTDRSTGYTTTQFYHGVVSPDGNIVIGGMQDNGTDMVGHPAFLNGWIGLLGGDGSYSAYDSANEFIYVSAQNANIFRYDRNFMWSSLRDSLYGQAPDRDEFMFITPFLIDPTNAARLFVGGKRLFQSPNRGATFTRASAPFGTTFQDKTNALAASNQSAGKLLIGTGNAIYRGNSLHLSSESIQLQSTTPRNGWVSSLIFDPNDDSVAYATYSSFGGDHVWKSTDSGATFSPIDGQGAGRLPDLPVHSLAVDPSNPDHLYVGTDLGVYFTENGGQSWQVEETGFGGVIVERVVINQPQGVGTAYLFAFTYGRGVWRAPLANVDGEPAYRVNPDINGFWFDASEPGHGIQVQVVDIGGTSQLLVTWYVYDQGAPIWLIGVGEIQGDRATVPMTVTRGTGFGDDFDPAQVIRDDWGSLELVFASDSELSVRWQSPLGEASAGTLTMQHLSQPVPVDVAGADISLCSTGVYWNPAQDGQGLIGETVMLDGQPGYAWSWYHYRDGQQLWLVGSAPFDGNRVVSDAFMGVDGEFPPRFDADTAVVERWGTVEFVFDSERTFTLNWSPEGQPESAGSLEYEQLAMIAESGCQ